MSDDRRDRGPAWTAASDQAAAAQADVSGQVREGFLIRSAAESAASGRPAEPVEHAQGIPYASAGEIVTRVIQLLEAGELAACLHAAEARAPGLSAGRPSRP